MTIMVYVKKHASSRKSHASRAIDLTTALHSSRVWEMYLPAADLKHSTDFVTYGQASSTSKIGVSNAIATVNRILFLRGTDTD